LSEKADCVFCKIVKGSIPSKKEAENEAFICVRDLHPQATEHLLIMPKAHVDSLAQVQVSEASELLGPLYSFLLQVAKDRGLLPHGFRTVINTGTHGGQTVYHLHAHLLGGEALSGGFA
jgi:histidine triad (HIT) family protein